MKSLDVHDYNETNLTDGDALKINDRSLNVYASYLKNSVMNKADRDAKDDAAIKTEPTNNAPTSILSLPIIINKSAKKAEFTSKNSKSLTLIGMLSALLTVAAVLLTLNAIGYLEFSPDRLSLSQTPSMAAVTIEPSDAIANNQLDSKVVNNGITNNDASMSVPNDVNTQKTVVSYEVFKEESTSKVYRDNKDAL